MGFILGDYKANIKLFAVPLSVRLLFFFIKKKEQKAFLFMYESATMSYNEL
jgi:hypothetical protein